MVLKDVAREDGMRGQGFSALWEDPFEELDADVGPTIRFPELRMESQYVQEEVQFVGTHN